MKRIGILMLGFLFCLAVSAWPQKKPATNIITFDVPGAGTNPGQGTLAWNISPLGWVSGDYIDADGVYHGFLRAPDGAITKFDVLGMGTSAGQGLVEVFGMNPELEIVGDYFDSNWAYHAFIRDPRGKITAFDCPGAGPGGSAASSVSPSGVISAMYFDANNAWHGCVRNPDGSFKLYDPPDAGLGAGQGTYNTPLDGINPEGAIVGEYWDANWVWHTYLRSPNGHITEIDAPNAGSGVDSGQGTLTLGINAAGEIWGLSIDTNYMFHGYLRSPDGTFTIVDVPNAGTGTFQGTTACWPIVCFGGINPQGTVTAGFLDGNYVMHGFLRTREGKIVTFDAPGAGTTPGSSSSTWYQGTQPASINPEGAISGFYTDANNVVHGFIRLPNPD